MKLTDFSLIALQTAFMQRDLTTQGICKGLQGELKKTVESTYSILMYQALSTLGDTPFAHELVDELAWQFHVDYYDKDATIDVKKALVKQSIRIHQKKGTPSAVVELMSTAFPSDAYLLEWFHYGGEPYHFKIVTSAFPSMEEETKFRKALNTVKNARSYLDTIELFTTLINYGVSNIRNNRTIEYTTNVGFFTKYSFESGENLSFGVGEKIYSFVDEEVN